MIGGMWEELGQLQFDFLVRQGLAPDMLLLDVGCGCLRGGIHFIKYLDSGNYYGLDLNQPLLDAGYDEEVTAAGLQARLPRENLICDSQFAFERFGKSFQYALAQSVFSHLPLNHIRLCLIKLAACIAKGGRFYATFFVSPPGHAIELPLLHEPGGVVTHPHRDPYHYTVEDLTWCAKGLPWKVDYLGEWNHPRAQKMILFTKR
jgi:SAM-dependent methyltransferase